MPFGSVSPSNIKIRPGLDYYFSIPVISFLIAILTTINLNLALILAIFILGIGLLFKRYLLIYLIILTLFLEAYMFSFYFAGARIRIIQAVEVVAIIGFLLALLLGKIRLKKTPIDLFLWSYILINLLSLVNTPSVRRGSKITILLISLALLYYVIVNLITKRELFDRAFNLLLYVGIVEILYGIYQILGGMSNYYLNTNLPIGHAGIMHAKFINSPWGRPYGTFSEPDWYGAISMFYAILFISLYFSRLHEKKGFYLFGMTVSIFGLFLSFVRASWFGFLGGIFFLSFIGRKLKLSKIRFALFVKVVSFLFLFTLTLNFLSPTFNAIIKNRFIKKGEAAIFMTNVRFIQAAQALKLFLKHPIIGNGPGSFAIQGVWGAREEYYESLVAAGELSVERRYNPSLLTTVLEDSGIIGGFFFFLLALKFLRYNLKMIPMISNRYQIICLGLLGGLVGLFFSYVFTHGLWIPFTWVFLGLNIASIRLGMLDGEQPRKV